MKRIRPVIDYINHILILECQNESIFRAWQRDLDRLTYLEERQNTVFYNYSSEPEEKFQKLLWETLYDIIRKYITHPVEPWERQIVNYFTEMYEK